MPKRLESDIPLGLVVIDIENGTSVPREAKSVSPDQIVSVPMKALLDGLSESGMWGTEPVPVDISSFMSSVTRTFNSSTSGGLAGRNLAVISKEYMNLNLKLGYHFNIVDAFIGEALNDNYIYFRFLGGVTDVIRRSRRARFIAEVLEQLDFRVEVHGDLVVGRLKKISKSRMYKKMKVLGGLIGYTRQLDVTMNNDSQIPKRIADFMRRIRPLTEVQDGGSN
jgi:pyruvate,water dikinase